MQSNSFTHLAKIQNYFLKTHTHICLTAFFPGQPGYRQQKGKPYWILLKQEMTGWQWHQLDNTQIICTTLQTDNHTSTPSLNFLRPDSLPDAQPTVSKH